MIIKIKNEVLKAYLWDFGGKISRQLVSFSISVILARLISPHDFGILASVFIFTGFSNVFSDMGLSASIIQRTRNLPIHLHSVFYFNLFIALLMTLTMFFCAPFFGEYYNEPRLIQLTRVLSVFFLLDAFNTVQNALLKRELKFNFFAKFRFISALTSGFCGILFAFLGYGIWALVFQILIELIIYDILVWKFSSYRPRFQFSFKALKSLWRFGFRIFLAKIINNIYNQIDVLIIGKLLSFSTLGYYQRSKSLNAMINGYTSESIMNIMFPLLSKIKNNRDEFFDKIIDTYGVILILSFYVSGLFFLISEDLILFFFTERWSFMIIFFKIMVIGGVVLPLNNFFSAVLSSKGESKVYLKVEILKKGLYTIPIILLLFFENIQNYLYLNIIVGLLTLLINFYYVKKTIQLNTIVLFFSMVKYICFLFFLVVSIELIFSYLNLENFWSIILISLLYSFLYFLLAIFLKLLGTKHLNLILKKIKYVAIK